MRALRSAIPHSTIISRQLPLRPGVTLLELLLVIMIIGLLTTAALKAYDTSLQAGRFNATIRTLNEISAAIVGNPDLVTGGVRMDYGYVGDVGKLPERLQDLVTQPSGIDPQVWRGPYVTNRIAENPTGYMTDAWGDSLIYRSDTLTISSRRGMSFLQPDSWIVRKFARKSADLFQNTVRGIVYDAKGNLPGDLDTAKLRVFLTWPINGYPHTDTAPSITNGNFEFAGRVTVGNHNLGVRWIDPGPPAETTLVTKMVSVSPGGKNLVEVHLPIPFH